MAASVWDWADLSKVGTVYLLHFHAPGNPETIANIGAWGKNGATHYLGFSESLEQRLERHRAGHGAKIIKAVTQRGLDWSLVRTWRGVGVDWENRLKMRGHYRELCPLCRGVTAYNVGIVPATYQREDTYEPY